MEIKHDFILNRTYCRPKWAATVKSVKLLTTINECPNYCNSTRNARVNSCPLGGHQVAGINCPLEYISSDFFRTILLNGIVRACVRPLLVHFVRITSLGMGGVGEGERIYGERDSEKVQAAWPFLSLLFCCYDYCLRLRTRLKKSRHRLALRLTPIIPPPHPPTSAAFPGRLQFRNSLPLRAPFVFFSPRWPCYIFAPLNFAKEGKKPRQTDPAPNWA